MLVVCSASSIFGQTLTVSSNALTISASAASTTSLGITSDTYWGITDLPSWLSADAIWDSGNKTVLLTATQNPYSEARTAQFTVYWDDANYTYLDADTITVVQSASAPFGVSDSVLAVGASAGSTATFTINTDSYWEISTIPSWLSVNTNYQTGNAQVTLTATLNPQYTIRTGTITVKRIIADGTYLTALVRVQQEASQYGVSSELVVIGAAEGSTASFDINASSSWTLSGAENWLTVSPVSSSSNGTVTLSAQVNTTIYYKADTLTVKTATGSIYSVIVVQQPSATAFTVSPWKIVLNDTDNSSLDFKITSNTNWGIINIPTWMYNTPVYGYGDKTVTMSATQNNGATNRVDSVLTYWYDAEYHYSERWIPVVQRSRATAQNIVLDAGWNLISLNVEPKDSSIASLFGNNIANVLEIKDASQYYRSDNNSVFNTLQYLGQGKAYLVKMKSATTIRILGTPSVVLARDIRYHLQTGWNLVGCPFATPTAVTSVLDVTNLSAVKDLKSVFIPNGTANTLTNMVPSAGYYVKMK